MMMKSDLLVTMDCLWNNEPRRSEKIKMPAWQVTPIQAVKKVWEKIAPLQLAERSWDNVGIMIGASSKIEWRYHV
jgi:hypothetical protein